MRQRHKALAILVLGAGLFTAGVSPASPYFQMGADPDLQQLIDRTQEDLRGALHFATSDKERDRYRSAQRHLSTFDRHLTKGHFDKGEMDTAINDIQHLLDHNTLQASNRDQLLHDVSDLRVARDRR